MRSSQSGISRSSIAITVVIIIIIVAGGAFVALRPTMTSSPTTTTAIATQSALNQTFVVDFDHGVDSLDPATTFQSESSGLNVWQALVAYPPNSTTLVPLLAQNYSISPDGLNYTFVLRQNVRFSNGDPFNAYVAWYSEYRCWIMQQFDSAYFPPLNMNGVTAADLNEFNTTNNIPPPSLMRLMENQSLAITVLSPYVLQFHLPTAFSGFLGDQYYLWVMEDPNVISAHGGVVAGQASAFANNAVGNPSTGPFYISQYVPSSYWVFTRNPYYWGGAYGVQPTPTISQSIWKVVPDSLTRLEDVEKGSTDYVTVDFSLASSLVGAPNVYVPKIGNGLAYQYMGMNMYKFPTNNLLFREAVAHALNMSEAVSLFQGYGTEFAQPIPPGVPGYDPNLQPYSYNLSLSKSLLSQMGYPNGKGIPVLQFYYPTDTPNSNLAAEYVQSQLTKIGITVKLVGMTDSGMEGYFGANVPPSSAGYPSFTYDVWSGPPDPYQWSPWMIGPLCYSSCNEAFYNSSVTNSLLQQAEQATNPSLELQLYMTASDQAYNDVPYIWIVSYVNANAHGIPVAANDARGFGVDYQYYGESLDLSRVYLVSNGVSESISGFQVSGFQVDYQYYGESLDISQVYGF